MGSVHALSIIRSAEAPLDELTLVHPAFFVPKGEIFRMVADLTARGVGINSMVDTERFAMETLQAFTATAQGDEEFISFDIADAFYTLSIEPVLQRYFGIAIDWRHYWMVGMPMGFSLSSLYLAEMMGLVMRHIRENGMNGVQYASGATYTHCRLFEVRVRRAARAQGRDLSVSNVGSRFITV